LRDTSLTLAEFTQDIVLFPQRLINVNVPKGFDFRNDVTINSSTQQAESDLGNDGRILLRASGTEPLIRVMVEGRMKQKVDHWAEQIATAVQHAANLQ
jgi:phosphoglucosamine mutase